MQIVECVPNFSEGRDQRVIQAIAGAIEAVEGVRLLDVDPGEATNRTVVTFVGPPSSVVDAAFLAIEKAAELIDMTAHHGAHARQGATDVCPFVPVSGVTMSDCVELARALGERVGKELGIPVYLYGEAATSVARRSLQHVRDGEYEGLREKLTTQAGAPDFGPSSFNERSGATAIGARTFLIAYNVNLNTKNPKLAKAIAWRIRDTPGPVRGPDGKLIRGDDGKLVKKPGLFTNCKATGWYIDEYKRAQITMNLTDYEVTPIHSVFDACCDLAGELGVRVTGSEIVGLVPRAALMAAGSHYLKKQGASPGAPTSELIDVANTSMGLDDVAPFDSSVKVVEEVLRDNHALVERTVSQFADLTSSGTPVPGGGSVAATSGALSASLLAMVANLSTTARGMEAQKDSMGELALKSQALKEELLSAIDRDSLAYDSVIRSHRLPKTTDEERSKRAAAIGRANLRAAEVPLSVLERTIELLEIAVHLVDAGMDSSLSDAAVAASAAAAAADGACYNVLINCPGIGDPNRAEELSSRALDLHRRAICLADDVRGVVLGRLKA